MSIFGAAVLVGGGLEIEGELLGGEGRENVCDGCKGAY